MSALAEALELMEKIDYREPGPIALLKLERWAKSRTANLSTLEVEAGRCAWCNFEPIGKRRRRYCSMACIDSAMFYCAPQKPAAKMWIFVTKQSAACAFCGLDYSDDIARMIYEKRSRRRYSNPVSPLSWFFLGDCTGDRWEVDHVIPLFKGGRGIGFENIQVICKPCHLKKTIQERKP